MISVTGEPGGHGVRCGVSIADMTAGMYAAFGIMLALRVKERTGRGQAIDVSMLEGQLSLLGTMIGAYFADGEIPRRWAPPTRRCCPTRPSARRRATSRWPSAARSSGRCSAPRSAVPELADDPRYRTNADRARNRDTLIPKLQEVVPHPDATRSGSRCCSPTGIPMGAINNIAQVVEHPQVKARGALVEMDHPRAGKVRMVGAPVRLSETPGSVRTPAPMLGEHTDEVLRELLGLEAAEIDALRAGGVIGPKP